MKNLFLFILAIGAVAPAAQVRADERDCQQAAEVAVYNEWKKKNPNLFGEVLSHITDVAVRRGSLVSYHVTIDATMGGTSRKWINYTVRTINEDGNCRVVKITKFAM